MRLPDMRITALVLMSLGVAILLGCTGFIGGSATSMGSRWDIYAGGGSYRGTHPSVSPDGLAVVYSTPAAGHGDIYRFDRATGRSIRLTTDPDYDGYPLYSRDGRHILFEHESKGVSHLYTMDTDGKNKRPLTDGPTFDFGASYSNDGQTIVFCRDQDGICHIWLMGADGTDPRPLTDGPWFDCAPSFSADGGRIVFRRMERAQAYLGPPSDREALTRRFGEIYVMNADGTDLQRLTHNSDDDVPISFSPDGTRIFFCREWRFGAMDSTGWNVQFFCDGFSPALSADGRTIVFQSARDRGIGLVDANGAGDRMVYRSRFGCSEPTFTPDGASVVFVEWPEEHGAGRIKILDLKTTATEPVHKIK